MLGNQKVALAVKGVQKAVSYMYMFLILLLLYSTIGGYVQSTDEWVQPLADVVVKVELGLIYLYLSIKMCKVIFGRVKGHLLNSDIEDILVFWNWLDDKVKTVLMYIGLLGFILLSLYI